MLLHWTLKAGRGLVTLAAFCFAACSTNPPVPPAPSAVPTVSVAPTPAFDYAACMTQAQADCGKLANGQAGAMASCMAVRGNTCKQLETPTQ